MIDSNVEAWVRKLFAAANWSSGVLRYAERWLLNFGVALESCPT